MARQIADGLSAERKATAAEIEAGTADKFPDTAGVKDYVDGVVGDIASALDAINGEIV